MTNSLILLVLALVLLWLAVTDQLARALDAWDVLTGKLTVGTAAGGAGATTTPNGGTAPTGGPTVHLPSLPPLGQIVM